MEKYIADIYMITNINNKILRLINKYDIVDDDLAACQYVLAKSDVQVIKINDKYVDINSIKNIEDIKKITQILYSNESSNEILSTHVYNPYIGQLFIKNIRNIKTKKLI